jgi:hypothetical protein
MLSKIIFTRRTFLAAVNYTLCLCNAAEKERENGGEIGLLWFGTLVPKLA